MAHYAFVLMALALAGQDVKWVPLNHADTPPPKAATPSPPTPEEAQTPTPAPTNATPVEQKPAVVPAPAPALQIANASPADPHRPIALTCVGSGTANKATSAFVWGYGGWGMIAGHKDRGFNDQVDLRLFMGDDRIRLPRTMLPGLHGGDHGWFKVHDLVADARSISASAGVGMLNNPKIFIDRVTGTISISGKSGDYAGQCQVIDPNAAPQF